MARPKEFDPSEALSKAVGVFWDCGFEKASLDTLMSKTGIARQSLYDTFGDKRAFYLSALAHYRDANLTALRRMFTSKAPIRGCFAKLLLGMCSESKASLQRGCLLMSANLERARDDVEIARLLDENQSAIESIFHKAIVSAQERREISTDKDALGLSRFFVATIQGMRAMGRVNPDRTMLEQVAQVALSALG